MCVYCWNGDGLLVRFGVFSALVLVAQDEVRGRGGAGVGAEDGLDELGLGEPAPRRTVPRCAFRFSLVSKGLE